MIPAPARIRLTALQQAYVLGAGSFALGGAAQGYLEIELPEPDWAGLEIALNKVIARHPMLRATIVSDTHLEIAPQVPHYKIEVVRPDAAVPARAELLKAVTESATRPFDRRESPLIRVLGTSLPDGTARLHFAYDFVVMDSSSIEVLMGDWARFYADPAAPVAVTEFNFADFAGYVHDERRVSSARAHWEGKMPGMPAAPSFAPGPLADVARSVKRSQQMTREESAGLRAYASARNSTPTAVVLTAYADALRLWVTDPSFLLNVTVSDRPPLAGIEEAVGDFTSTLLIDISSSAEPFAERVDDVQAKLWDAIEHRAMSGLAIGRELQRRRLSLEPVAPVVFTSLLGIKAAGLWLGTVIDSDSRTPQAVCDMVLSEGDGMFVLTMYSQDDDAFAGIAAGLWEDFLAWLRDIARSPASGPLGIPAASRAAVIGVPEEPAPRMLSCLNDVALALPGEDTALALLDLGGTSLTYAQVRERSAVMAGELARQGAGPGALVAIALGRGIDQYLWAIAVARTGAAYLPVDMALPLARRRQLIELARPDAVITAGPGHWAQDVGNAVQLDSAALPTGQRADDDMGWLPPADPADLAYVMYTSGSTGEPKGVAMQGSAVANTLNDVLDRFNVGAADRVLATAGLHFDLSVFDLFGMLAVGGSVVLASAGTERMLEAMVDAMHRMLPTIWNSVPALFEMVLQHIEYTGGDLPASLRLVLLSGDVVPPGLAARVQVRASRPPRLVALGGATEAGIWSNFTELDQQAPDAKVPYGHPLRGQWLSIVDGHRRPRPTGCIGEIVIMGDSLAQGYLRDPGRTAQKFYRDPGTGLPSYATGDLGFATASGAIEILGRLDQQVKIGGYRIELGEIETAIFRVPGVRAVAVCKNSSGPRPVLQAFVAASGVTNDEIANAIRGELPPYMVPKVWTSLPELPLTANGKVDRAALERLAAVPAEQPPSAAQQEWTPTEQWLGELWSEILQRSIVSRESNFFELGGDSLLAARLSGRIRERGVDVPIRLLFAASAFPEMAALIDERRMASEQDGQEFEGMSTEELESMVKELGI